MLSLWPWRAPWKNAVLAARGWSTLFGRSRRACDDPREGIGTLKNELGLPSILIPSCTASI
eukprot:5350363-Amphidinium_carterae.2